MHLQVKKRKAELAQPPRQKLPPGPSHYSPDRGKLLIPLSSIFLKIFSSQLKRGENYDIINIAIITISNTKFIN